MMKLHSINDLYAGKALINKPISVGGWVRTRRDSKAGISFIQLNDGSCLNGLQIVVPNHLPNYESEILKLTTGCSLIAHGSLIESQGQGQQYEMQAEQIEIVGWIDDPEHYPIQAKHHSFEYLREVAHLRPRTNTFAALTRVRHGIAQAIHRFF